MGDINHYPHQLILTEVSEHCLNLQLVLSAVLQSVMCAGDSLGLWVVVNPLEFPPNTQPCSAFKLNLPRSVQRFGGVVAH